MPGFLLHQNATALCLHAGQAQPTMPNVRVRVSGNFIVTQTAPYVVAGCSLPPPAGGPCVTAQWVTAAVRIRASDLPILLQDSQAICAPTGSPLNVVATQMRVKGS